MIDFFLTPKAKMYQIEEIQTLPITISDHAPLALKWKIGHRPTSKQWRLNASLLNDNEFISFRKSEFKNYLDTNISPEASPLILWGCANACIRGHIISFACNKKRKKEAKQQELEENNKGSRTQA